ncbi:MAG: hypothetical protein V1773_14695 [bacterium]
MNNIEPMDELLFIKKIMTDSQRIMFEDGHSFIFWGIIVTIGQIITYLVYSYHIFIEHFVWVWPILIGFGWVYTILINYKKYGKSRTHTFAGKIMGALWRAVGFSAMILGFVPSLAGAIHGIYINPLISAILGLAFYVTGYLYGKKWVSTLAYGWWIGSIYMFIFPYLYSLLIMSGMVICLQIIPGLYLRNQYKRNIRKLNNE